MAGLGQPTENISPPALDVSRHLRLLLEAGFVSVFISGKRFKGGG
jgi:hypothetical protein